MQWNWDRVLRKEMLRLRREEGITPYRVSKDIGISPTTIGKWLRADRKHLSRKNTELLARYLGFYLCYEERKETRRKQIRKTIKEEVENERKEKVKKIRERMKTRNNKGI